MNFEPIEPIAPLHVEYEEFRRRQLDLIAQSLNIPGRWFDEPMALQAAADRSDRVTLAGQATLKAAGDGEPGRIEIHAYNGGELRVKGYPFPIIVDAEGLAIPSQVRPILIDHHDDADSVLGQTDAITLDRQTGVLTATGAAIGVSEKAQRVKALAASGYAWQASIGAVTEDREIVPAGETVVVNGRRFAGPCIVARKATLREISFVPTGADHDTAARIAANAADQGGNMPTFEEWVASLGFDPATLTEVQREKLTEMYSAANKPADPPATPAAADPPAAPPAEDPALVTAKAVTDIRAAAARETQRIQKVTLLAKDYPDIQARAIAEGWDESKAELAVLRAARPKAPAGYAHTNDTTPEILEAALCRAGGLVGVDKMFPDKTLSAADKLYGGSIGVQGFLLEAAARNGHHFSAGRFKSQHRQILQAAFSAADVGGILSNVQAKFLLNGWNSVEPTWETIAAIGTVNNFKETSFYRLTSAGTWDEVGPTGELKHGKLGEDSYTNRAKTYGELIALTRQMQIDDDLNALSDMPRMLGRKAALTLAKIFWAKFLASKAALFPVDNSRLNYFDGASSALSSTSLSTAVQMFREQKDSEGNPLGVEPAILLVSPSNEATADELYTSRNINTGGAATSTKVPNNNTHAGKYKPAVSSYLSNTSIHAAADAVHWFLLADPLDLAVMQVVFLDGRRNPTVETAEADFGTLGIQTRAYSDWGVNTHEHRAGVMSKGKA